MKKDKSDLEKWHKEYREKNKKLFDGKKELRRRELYKELGVEDENTQSSIPDIAKCAYCDKQGKFYYSPWRVPASLHLCSYHWWILPFWPVLRLHAIVVVLLIIAIIAYIFF